MRRRADGWTVPLPWVLQNFPGDTAPSRHPSSRHRMPPPMSTPTLQSFAVLMGEAFDVMKKDVSKAPYRLESFAVLMGEAFGLNVNPKSNDESTDKKLKYFVNTSNLPQKGQSGQGIRHEGGWIQHCCSTYACRYFHHFTWGERWVHPPSCCIPWPDWPFLE